MARITINWLVWLLAVLLTATAIAYLDQPSPPRRIGSLSTEPLTIIEMD